MNIVSTPAFGLRRSAKPSVLQSAGASIAADLRTRAEAVATVAAANALAVDRDARFPEAAIAAARAP